MKPNLHSTSGRVVGIAALIACLAVAAGALALFHHTGGFTGKAFAPASARMPVSTTATQLASDPTGAAKVLPNGARITPSTSVPSGKNIAAADVGGEIESITGAYGPGHTGRFLIDGSAESVWKPEGEDGINYPQDIVLSFYKRDAASIAAVVIEQPEDRSGPKDLEISTSMDSPTEGFSKVAVATLDPNLPVQAVAFPPVNARYLKLSVLSGAQPTTLGITGIRVIEGSPIGYATLLARHPEIPDWKTSVRRAAQMGIDWLEPASMDWQKQNQCFGCHVQAQTLMGLSVAMRNRYVVSPSCVQDIVAFMRTKLAQDGTEKDEGSDTKSTPTQFAAMGYAYFDEATGAQNDEALLKHANWMLKKLKPTGELVPDMDEPPIAQGSFMTTGNSAMALMQAFAETGETRFQQAAEKSLSFLAATQPKTTQDKVFKILSLSRFGSPQQRALVGPLLVQLQSEQHPDGGWGDSAHTRASSALSTGQVLFAYQEAGVSIDSPQFKSGVGYLITTQTASGSWPPGNAARPSEFTPTMWAVIGLAGAFEAPKSDSLKSELDRTGHVALYVNFDFNQATLRPDAQPIIAQVLKLLEDNPELSLSIVGHTDNVGARDYNVKLSQMRAATVVSSLVAAHIAPGRLSSGGFGPDQPAADNDTEKGRAQNRRVELVKM